MSLAPGSVADLEELDSLSLESIQSELANWQRIVFYGDMEGSSNTLDKGKDQSTLPPLTVPPTSAPSIPRNESNPQTFLTTVGVGWILPYLTILKPLSGSSTPAQQPINDCSATRPA